MGGPLHWWSEKVLGETEIETLDTGRSQLQAVGKEREKVGASDATIGKVRSGAILI